jgi:site-specific DNA recombinase
VIADATRQLAQYRATLDAGADPAVVGWINQATAAKAHAKAERARLRATAPTPLGRDALRRMVTEAGDLVRALDRADSALRAQLYERLGIEGLYQPSQRLVVITAELVCPRLVSEVRPQPLAYPRLTTTLAL